MRAPARPFPWEAAMAAGLGLLRLSPDAFWRMTPRELAAAMAPFTPPASALDRAGFEDLLRRFPDTR
ncbi:rcc01693 family protein [Aquabacter sediminis]|uniref:rcc01693 family protein n=1 Tax=Aquabacter sediminis TaxID=3029197 RepID=UPI00237DC4E5|nr:rcc01693 family protein [Aquabacter sp. P-9]MDE1567587.1 phage tail assembly chaperone [Aquabacter sp. P-9]